MRHSREALHARHGDELLVHHLQHVGAHQQQRQALQVEGERQDGQGEMMEVVPRDDALPVVGIGQARAAGAAGGEPAGVERQQRQQHHADPELGRGTRRQHGRHRDPFDPAAALPGEPGAGQHAEDVGDDQRGQRQDQRVGQHLEQDGEHRPALEEGQAELALQKIAEIDEVLLPHRLIEAELLEHRLLLVGVQVLVDERGERRARHQPEHEEQDGRDGQQRQRVVGEALEDKLIYLQPARAPSPASRGQ